MADPALLTELQIAHLEAHQAEFDEFYTYHYPVRDYLAEHLGVQDLYINLCNDMGITPIS